jgi:4-amino-4-deoxy-L-arabinose transferase-like glycosyltransferase
LKGWTNANAALAIIAIAYAALAFGYITLTPIWQNPDEPAHYNYVAFVAQTGGLPVLEPGDWDSALLERLKTGTLQPGDSVGSIRYENWQPPLFYLLATPVFRLGSAADTAGVLFRLRLFDAVLGALTLVFAYAVAREVLAPQLAVAVPFAIVGVPMFVAVSAAVSADPLANLLSAGLVLLIARRLRRAASNGERWSLMTGAVLGLGLLTKLALAIFLPVGLIVLWVRSARRIREAVLFLGAAALVLMPWLAHQVTTYGWADPFALSRHAAVVADQQRFPGLSFNYIADLSTTTFHSFWAQFGWMAIVAPPRLYLIWGIACLIGLVGAARDWRCLSKPVWKLLLGTLLCAMVAYVGYNLAFEQFQGRYLFTAVVPIAVLLVGGWAAFVPPRIRPAAVFAIALALVALNGYTLLRVLVPGFAGSA